jgi:hypothetical protein
MSANSLLSEDNDLYNPFIPPTLALLRRISDLIRFRMRNVTKKTPNDIGNGKMKITVSPIPK